MGDKRTARRREAHLLEGRERGGEGIREGKGEGQRGRVKAKNRIEGQ